MTKRLVTAFVIFSVLVLAFVVTWTSLRIVHTRRENIEESRSRYEVLGRSLISAYLTDGSFSGGTVSTVVSRASAADPDLLGLFVHDGSTTHYLYARSEAYVSLDRSPRGDVQGIPTFIDGGVLRHIGDRTLVFPDNRTFHLSLLTSVLNRNDLVPVAREILIALLSFLLITAVFIVVLPYVSRSPEETGATATVDRTPVVAVQDSSREAGHTVPSDASEPSPERVAEAATEGEGRAPVAPSSEARETVSSEPAGPSEEPRDTAPSEPVSPPVAVPEEESAGDVPVDSDGRHETGRAPSDTHEGLYSPSSGLGWEEYLEERLSTELKRAASFDQDLVLMLFQSEGIYRGSDRFRLFADAIREFFTFRDLCFEYGESGAGVIVPNIDLDQGVERCEEFLRSLSAGRSDRAAAAGLSARNGRLMSGRRLIREADGALRKARDEHEGIVAFRVDPEKYRAYIASRA